MIKITEEWQNYKTSQSSQELSMCWHSMLLPPVLNNTWCAEFASIVIELVITTHCKQIYTHNYMPFVYKLQLRTIIITLHYVAITLGFSQRGYSYTFCWLESSLKPLHMHWCVRCSIAWFLRWSLGYIHRLDTEHSSIAHVQYFAECFTNPGRDLSGLYCGDTPLGRTVLVDSANCSTLWCVAKWWTCVVCAVVPWPSPGYSSICITRKYNSGKKAVLLFMYHH